jgi:hypothetical protein
MEKRIKIEENDQDHYTLADVINPTYLNTKNQKNIRQEFEENSSLFLPNFLLLDKYDDFAKYIEINNWDHVGPPVLQSFFTPSMLFMVFRN